MSETDDELLARAVVVVGAPRSGTSLMGLLLSQHPQLAYVNEPRLVWRFGNDAKSDMLRREDARPEVRRHIRRTFARRVREEGRARLLEKTPATSLRLGFVDAVFPDCRFVHVIRDGRESVLGIRDFWANRSGGMHGLVLRKRLREVRLRQLPRYAKEFARRLVPSSLSSFMGPNVWGPRIPGVDALVRELDLLEVCCLQWRMCVELACQYGRSMPPDRYMEVRLEEISEPVMSRVLEFCELPEHPPLVDELRRRFKPEKPGGRTASATPEELEVIRTWTEPTLRWLGYV
jgi:hypothetical protein